jgi:peptide/nickel transport system substrate-binding protein
MLKDDRVREALARMVDVDALLAPIGTGDRVSGPFVPSSPFYNHDVAPIAYDPNGAADLLAQAGYTFNGTRWLGPDGKELRLRLVAPSNLETAQDVVINVQSQLQGRGIGVDPEFLGVAEWKEKVWRDGEFDLVLSQWSFDRSEDIWEQFHSSGTRNFGHYANPDVDRILAEARAATDPQQKKALLREAHAKIAADHPMIFLWTLDSYAALSTRVKNVVVHPFYFFTWAGDWTLAQ